MCNTLEGDCTARSLVPEREGPGAPGSERVHAANCLRPGEPAALRSHPSLGKSEEWAPGICQRRGKASRIAAMNINLLAVKFSSSPTNAKYGLLIFPHSNPSGSGLDPNDISQHAYETLEQLWQAMQTCELVIVPNIATLEAELEQAKMPVPVAQLSEETARQMGFK